MNAILEITKKILLGILLTVFLLFCGDWGVILYKIANHGNAFGTVTVHSMVTSSLKDGKYAIYSQQPVDETCMHSLFPHQGYTPCWYLQRHAEQITSY